MALSFASKRSGLGPALTSKTIGLGLGLGLDVLVSIPVTQL